MEKPAANEPDSQETLDVPVYTRHSPILSELRPEKETVSVCAELGDETGPCRWREAHLSGHEPTSPPETASFVAGEGDVRPAGPRNHVVWLCPGIGVS